MAKTYKISISVASQKGDCAEGHKVGDEWVVGGKTPEGLCTWAFNSLYPAVMVLMYGGSFPWEGDPDAATVACPDVDNPVVFKLRRIRE